MLHLCHLNIVPISSRRFSHLRWSKIDLHSRQIAEKFGSINFYCYLCKVLLSLVYG